MSAYRGPKPLDFSYPAEWTLREEEGTVSLWKSEKGGAITISTAVHRDPKEKGDARQQCERFAGKHAFDPPRVDGNEDAAEAAFTDQEGAWCKVRFLAAGSRMLMATYNASAVDQVEEAEADAILASLRLK